MPEIIYNTYKHQNRSKTAPDIFRNCQKISGQSKNFSNKDYQKTGGWGHICPLGKIGLSDSIIHQFEVNEERKRPKIKKTRPFMETTFGKFAQNPNNFTYAKFKLFVLSLCLSLAVLSFSISLRKCVISLSDSLS